MSLETKSVEELWELAHQVEAEINRRIRMERATEETLLLSKSRRLAETKQAVQAEYDAAWHPSKKRQIKPRLDEAIKAYDDNFAQLNRLNFKYFEANFFGGMAYANAGAMA